MLSYTGRFSCLHSLLSIETVKQISWVIMLQRAIVKLWFGKAGQAIKYFSILKVWKNGTYDCCFFNVCNVEGW